VNAAGLWLSWSGIPGDSFQVAIVPSLDAPWSPLTAEIVTNGYAFACVTPLPAHTCFYRVQRVSRLQLPDSMVWIPPGSFLMGTAADDPHRTADELAQFSVTFTRGFWIGRHEVTQSEYQNLLCANPAAFRTNLENPVEKVSWAEAVEYCRRLTEREQQAGRLPADYAYRLPTEAEWEYATRAGSLHQFTFGDDFAALAQYGWYSTNSGGIPIRARFDTTPGGCRDGMAMLWKWCWNWINRPGGKRDEFCGDHHMDCIGSTAGALVVALAPLSVWMARLRYNLAVPATRQCYGLPRRAARRIRDRSRRIRNEIKRPGCCQPGPRPFVRLSFMHLHPLVFGRVPDGHGMRRGGRADRSAFGRPLGRPVWRVPKRPGVDEVVIGLLGPTSRSIIMA
jgi:hypothetical protein